MSSRAKTSPLPLKIFDKSGRNIEARILTVKRNTNEGSNIKSKNGKGIAMVISMTTRMVTCRLTFLHVCFCEREFGCFMMMKAIVYGA